MWAVITVCSLVVLIILILCVPLDVLLHIDVYGKPKFSMRLEWLFGLVSKEVRKRKKKPEEKKKAVKGKPKFIRWQKKAQDIFEILQTKGLLSQLKRLLRDILSRLRIRKLEANFRVGLDNPADTGLLFAFIGPATVFLNYSFPYRIRVQPSYDKAVFEGYLHGTVRLRPIQLVPSFIRFAFSLAAMRLLKKLALTKWKRKK